MREFGFTPSGAVVGAMAAVEGRRGVHPQWLYFFRAARLDDAVTRVASLGGVTLPPTRLPNRARCVVCEDPQGGAFGLMEPAP